MQITGQDLAIKPCYREWPQVLLQSRHTSHSSLPLLQHCRSTPGQEFQDGGILSLDVGWHGLVKQVVSIEEMQLPAKIDGEALHGSPLG